MIHFEGIRLVIWDMDDTFWSGTLSLGPVSIVPSNVRLVKDLAACGILNSVCSKNDYEPVREELIKAGVWDYFRYPSVNWEEKGLRVREILKKTGIPQQEALYVDDNPLNLEDALRCCPDLITAGPDIFPLLAGFVRSLSSSASASSRDPAAADNNPNKKEAHPMYKLDHVAVVTDNIYETVARYEKLLGVEIRTPAVVEGQGIISTYIPLDGVGIELLQPIDPEGGIQRFLDKKGPGIHHFSLKPDDREEAIRELSEDGVRLLLGEANGKKSVFIHPKSTGGVLIELCE